MKIRNITVFLLLLLIIPSMAAAENSGVRETVPAPLQEYIGSPVTPVEFIKITEPDGSKKVETITSQQALEDIKMLEYIFEAGYSGRDYFGKKGVSFNAMYSDLRQLAEKGGTVKTADMEKIICKHLSGITDGHLKIRGTRTYSFYHHKNAYFADMMAEKRKDGFYITESKISQIPAGSLYTGKEGIMFPTLSPPGRRFYLVGKLSFKPIDSMEAEFGGKKVQVPLHPIKISKRETDRSDTYTTEKLEGITCINLTSLDASKKETLDEFVKSGASLKSEKCFILDISNNQGGSSAFARDFVRNLNGSAQWIKNFAFLKSPATLQSTANLYRLFPNLKSDEDFDIDKELEAMKKNPVRKWEVFTGNQQRETGSYKGKAIIISNRNVASSGEALLNFWRSIPGGIIVGENSGGIGNFGDVREYMLPGSKMVLTVPCKLFIVPGVEEGTGYMPDCWIDADMPEIEIIRWLKDPENYEPVLE